VLLCPFSNRVLGDGQLQAKPHPPHNDIFLAAERTFFSVMVAGYLTF